MLQAAENLMSADEFWDFVQLPHNRDRRFELVEGVIVEMAGGTGGMHGEVSGNLLGFVWFHARDRQAGRVTSAETCYVLSKNPNGKDIVRCPDVGFVSIERAPEPLGTGYVPFAPDLAIEVISPSNHADEIQSKVLDYLRCGTRLVWMVYPESRTVNVHTPSGSRILSLEDTLDGGEVLPGFALAVKDIFPQ